MIKFSIIIPVFNRPEDVNEFLNSLTGQSYTDYEVILSDGSPTDILHPVIEKYKESLPLSYFHVRKLGASESRNLGCENAKGKYFLFIDSDCILPPDYLQRINNFLNDNDIDAFGGPDRMHDSFTPVQKAINYAMTSLFTTGGIRGKKKHVGKFQLRGFNMGVKAEVYNKLGGFSGMQVAEDIDLSMRILEAGYTTALIPEAFVYHKRRTSLTKFYKQLHMHGKGRIDLYLRHKNALKPVHFIPSLFLAYLILCPLLLIIYPDLFIYSIYPLILYTIALIIDATIQNKSIYIGFISTISAWMMLIAYGSGLIKNVFTRIIFKSKKDTIKATVLKN